MSNTPTQDMRIFVSDQYPNLKVPYGKGSKMKARPFFQFKDGKLEIRVGSPEEKHMNELLENIPVGSANTFRELNQSAAIAIVQKHIAQRTAQNGAIAGATTSTNIRNVTHEQARQQQAMQHLAQPNAIDAAAKKIADATAAAADNSGHMLTEASGQPNAVDKAASAQVSAGLGAVKQPNASANSQNALAKLAGALPKEKA